MKRIEDIKVIKKRKAPASPAPDLESENYNKKDEEDIREDYSEIGRPKIRNLGLKIFFGVFIAALITFCWGLSLSRAKAKITAQTSGINKDFSVFLDAIGNKNTITLSEQINNFNQKSENSLLVLQSAGQGIYIFSLLYPKERSSQMTAAIDTIRVSHLLTGSYEKFLTSVNPSSSNTSNDWMAKVNSMLAKIRAYNTTLPEKILYARISGNEAKAILANISSSSFSEEEKITLENLKKLSEVSTTFFQYLSDLPQNLDRSLTFGGGRKSYLILFLNNTEIRPGGGFLGSFARLDLENGEIKNIDFEKNIYTLDKSFLAAGNKVTPPKELQAITTYWTMRDANMSADFSESSKKVAWFYQQESGEPVDGVIALDTTLFRNLLKIVGPIVMPEYGLSITDQNFLSDVQYQVEIGYYQNQANWAENQPKEILADMMPKFLAALFKTQNLAKVGREIMLGIAEKHLLFYFTADKLEDLSDGINAAGKIHKSSGDYLYSSDANLGGYKSSLEVAETLRQSVEIKNDGSVSEKLSILRKHNGSYNWPDGINNNFVKVYLPLATKVEAVNFISGDNNPHSEPAKAEEKKWNQAVEFDKNVVSFWQNTKPGEQSQTDIDYSREKAIALSGDAFDYQITIQKQQGVECLVWQLDLVYPEGWQPQNVEGYDSQNRRIILSEEVRQDQVFRLRFIRSGTD